MLNVKYVILGAGPSGLAFAHSLAGLGQDSFVVIEQAPVAGGLCRSEEVDGAPLDIGGGHFLDVKRSEVLELLFQFLPQSEWQEYTRCTKIRIHGTEIDYPFEANLWQLPLTDQVDYLQSIAEAGCVRGHPMPESFEQWISWKLGRRIAEEYMLPYNRKIWSIDLDRLGTYWLYKLPDVSFRDTLQSCLQKKAYGAVPAHGVFLYPKRFGYGEVWRRMAAALGDKLLLSTPVDAVDVSTGTVNGEFRADNIISTIPWGGWLGVADVPADIRTEIDRLQYSSIDVDYVGDNIDTDAHWIYDPDEAVPHHRVLCRHNFSVGTRGYWTETNSRRAVVTSDWRHHNEYAYPLNTRDKPEAIERVLDWARGHRILGLGRWGRWEHANSDVVVAESIAAAHGLESGDV